MNKIIGREVLFLKTDDNNPRNGEGDFIRLKNGDIMFAYTKFSGLDWEDGCEADIVAIFSNDEGKTWQNERIIFRHDNDSKNIMCPSLLRMNNGDIGIIFIRKTLDCENGVPYISRSDDEGETWSNPKPVIDDKENYFVVENGHAVKLKNGRIIIPANLHSEKVNGIMQYNHHAKKCIFASDDDGKTWNEISERQDIPFPSRSETGLQETCIYEQEDGTLRALSRTDMSFQYECFSYDGGETWTSPEPNRFFSSPESPLMMKRVGRFTVAVFNPIPAYTTRDTETTWGRTPLVCAVSTDDGKTFPKVFFLEDDPENSYCYPSIFDGGDYMLVAYYHSNNSGVPLNSAKIKKVTYDELADWYVYSESSFWRSKSDETPGTKIKINKQFGWADVRWYIPAAYKCEKGLVVDFFAEIEPEKVSEFFDKWDIDNLDEAKLAREQRTMLESENPLNIDFRAEINVNGMLLRRSHGCGLGYVPDKIEISKEAEAIIDYYGLDKSKAWVFRRISFPWADERKPDIKSVTLTMIHDDTTVYGIRFKNPEAGDKIIFAHPIHGTEHTLTVKSCEHQEFDKNIGIEGFILPTHHKIMTFSLDPDIPERNFRIRDCEENDAPRPSVDPKQESADNGCTAIAIIGGADGPTAVFMAQKDTAPIHSACSALKFEPTDDIEWQMIFKEKLTEDLSVELI